MTQLITRLDNTLDLFFTDHPSQIIDINMLPGMSDHDIMVITADIKSKFIDRSSRKLYRIIKPTGMQLEKVFLHLQLNFIRLLTENSDVEYLWSTFKNTMLALIAINIPSKKCNKQAKIPSITNHIRKLIKKQTLYMKYRYKTSKSTEAYTIASKV